MKKRKGVRGNNDVEGEVGDGGADGGGARSVHGRNSTNSGACGDWVRRVFKRVKVIFFPFLFPLAVVGVKRGWWSVGYAAAMCGLSYAAFVDACRALRIKLFKAVLDDIETIYHSSNR